MPDTNDMELLREYAQRNSETAFAELVRRHLDLVYSAAFRHINIAAHAEEITQAVFIILARKAASLHKEAILEGWLFETTRLTALSFLRGERRRQFREQEAYMRSTLQEPADDLLWDQLSPLLDEAMACLGKKDRDAVVLRFFKDKNAREVAVAMQMSEAAAQRRIHRAVEKLRRFFTKRGVSSTAAILAGTIAANSVHAAPVGLAKTISVMAAAKGTAASASTLTLIKGALKIMAWTKIKTGIVVGAVILAAAGSSTIVINKVEHRHAAMRDALREFTNTPAGGVAMEALYYLQGLKPKGQLPGITSNTPVAIEIPWIVYDSKGGKGSLVKTNFGDYPISFTLTAHANDVNDRYHYVVTKASATNGWELKKAWLSDTNGTVLKEFPVP